tara:strand:+ start:932 stop:1147 length:216 start_codon:yes stop_codon:yes gene_type:complete
MNLEEYDSAYGDFQKILNLDQNNRAAHKYMKDCQRQKKMAERVDHYKGENQFFVFLYLFLHFFLFYFLAKI